ncbi:uncharacterized protein [Triticum aestivum]|uniref:uncharacterized protein isoform X4 n=1 Tax=Triticum aestivum TaxID=4565 RepID=UPI001D00281E|nr:uncharacterized protein LOC123068821 isoform X4 [Triticum aestivum]XP_044377150.1 uncharacterized protein LOC123099078 isoform X4 [Triticum aestivum]XP_044394614.1 uncharacterized protein LOC123119034 isoform X4 [Triticum aestivum]XP_044394620.1 uncharacterized protein LOC123119036 isoform X4 [Triticum aestivum]
MDALSFVVPRILLFAVTHGSGVFIMPCHIPQGLRGGWRSVAVEGIVLSPRRTATRRSPYEDRLLHHRSSAHRIWFFFMEELS